MSFRAAKFFDQVLIGDFSDPDACLRATVDYEKEQDIRLHARLDVADKLAAQVFRMVDTDDPSSC